MLSRLKKFATSKELNGTRMSILTITLILLTYINYSLVEHYYYRAYYTGCVDLASSHLFDAKQQDYLHFKCNFNTKKKMFEFGAIDEILLFTDVFPDKD